MTVEELVERLGEIRNQGFIRTQRRGATGLGYTLEKLLNLSENNISDPDLGEVELKAHRRGGSSLITLFTLDRGVWVKRQREVIQEFGKEDAEHAGRQNLYCTLSTKRFVNDLRLVVEPKQLQVRSRSGEVIASWTFQQFIEAYQRKVKNTVLVSADVRFEEGYEMFHFDTAKLMISWLLRWNVEYFFTNDLVVVDLRLHRRSNGTVRNHGTAFRASFQNLDVLFPLQYQLPLDRIPSLTDSVGN